MSKSMKVFTALRKKLPFPASPLASPFGRGGRAKRGRRGYTVTAKTLSVACGDSSPRGRAKHRTFLASPLGRGGRAKRGRRGYTLPPNPLSRLRRQLSQRESQGPSPREEPIVLIRRRHHTTVSYSPSPPSEKYRCRSKGEKTPRSVTMPEMRWGGVMSKAG